MALVLHPPDIDFRDPAPFTPGGTAGQILSLATQAATEGRQIVIREICRELSLAPGAPYSHYGSSSHLESVVVYNGLLSMAAWITEKTRDVEEPRQRLVAACRAYRSWALGHPSLFSFILPTSGRHDTSPFAAHVMHASQAISVPSILALREGWDTRVLRIPGKGPEVHPLQIPGVVSLNIDESRIANALWITVHGAVVLELAFGIHDGWNETDAMFDWLVATQIEALLEQPMSSA